MTRVILLTICSLILISGCSRDYLLDRKEDKLVGTWEFEKVFYKRDVALFRDDITSAYRDDLVDFYADYSATYDDYSLSALFDGEWSIFADEDDNGLEFFVDAVFFDFVNGEDFAVFGSIDRLNERKLHLEAYDALGKFTFKLRRR